MKCLKCGKELPNGAAFCPWCGASMKNTASAAAASTKAAQPQAKKIPLPTAAVPTQPKGSAQPQNAQSQPQTVKKSFFGLFIRTALFSIGVYTITSGFVLAGVVVLFIWLCVVFGGNNSAPAAARKPVKYSVSPEGLELTWEDSLDQFAVALNGVWEDTGSGNKILIPAKSIQNLFNLKLNKIYFVVAKITDKGVEYYGETYLIPEEWNYRLGKK